MSNKTYGLRKEREVKKMLYEHGALHVVRARGSFGHFDIIAFFQDKTWLISVKSTRQKYYSVNAELKKLRKLKLPYYCEGELWVYYSPNKDRKEKGWVRHKV